MPDWRMVLKVSMRNGTRNSGGRVSFKKRKPMTNCETLSVAVMAKGVT